MVHICANKDCIDIPLSNAFFSSCEDMVQIQLMLNELFTQDFDVSTLVLLPALNQGPEVIKVFPYSTQLSMKFQMLISTRNSAFFRLR